MKGKAQAVTIYEPLDAALGHESKLANKAAFDEAYAAYLKQHWEQAERGFMALSHGDKDPLYPLYLDRIHALKHAHLPHDWDGSFTHTSK